MDWILWTRWHLWLVKTQGHYWISFTTIPGRRALTALQHSHSSENNVVHDLIFFAIAGIEFTKSGFVLLLSWLGIARRPIRVRYVYHSNNHEGHGTNSNAYVAMQYIHEAFFSFSILKRPKVFHFVRRTWTAPEYGRDWGHEAWPSLDQAAPLQLTI